MKRAKKSLTKADRAKVLELTERVKKMFLDSAPFAVESHREAVESISTQAKVEVENFVQNRLIVAGMKYLEEEEKKLLEGKSGDEIEE